MNTFRIATAAWMCIGLLWAGWVGFPPSLLHRGSTVLSRGHSHQVQADAALYYASLVLMVTTILAAAGMGVAWLTYVAGDRPRRGGRSMALSFALLALGMVGSGIGYLCSLQVQP